ncbi:unnamed protein product [Ilex paraguariensis]|uniref:Bet v I/Major latex protein domain-containing protein n=1 Tax=Ilex paraguariensis TaxID=185542 RepID=A0ABC8R1Q1_9AQUA
MDGIGLGPLKHRIDEINEETFVYHYTLIEGEDLLGKLEKVSHETKFEPSPDGGSISKITSKYYTLDDAAITEDEIKASKEKAMGMYKAVEGYLLQNPDAYA